MRLLAQQAGFTIEKTKFDSTSFQFWGSELYKKNIPLYLPGTEKPYPFNDAFSDREMKEFEKKPKN